MPPLGGGGEPPLPSRKRRNPGVIPREKATFSAYFAAMRSGLCGVDSSGSFSETVFEPL